MTNELLTFTNCKHTKAELLESLQRHADLDQIVQGVYWENGKGCAVGCSIRGFAPGQESKHCLYETLFGISEEMAHLEDKIFENLPPDLAKKWPLRFTQAIPEGVSLTIPLAEFKLFLLTEVCKFDREGDPKATSAVTAVVALLNRRIAGDEPAIEEWSAARSAAESAVWSATESAARSAVRSAAESAVWSATESAAESAVWSATKYAARSAVRIQIADKLLQILEAAK